jgi:putative alpha-1,2-mannosidase
VQQVTRNGQKLTQPFLAQQDVAKGGTLVFVMGARPARK